jgi:hypothetical protein
MNVIFFIFKNVNFKKDVKMVKNAIIGIQKNIFKIINQIVNNNLQIQASTLKNIIKKIIKMGEKKKINLSNRKKKKKVQIKIKNKK